MTTNRPCMVLRCGKPMVDVFVTGDGPARVEYAVCAEHDAHLKADGEWRLMQSRPNHGGLELLVDSADLAADGAWLVEGSFGLHSDFTTQVSSRPPSSVLSAEARRWGQRDQAEELRLFLTREQLLGLRDLLNSAFGAAS